jgi:O-antigen/teichoic acid export membrane protein
VRRAAVAGALLTALLVVLTAAAELVPTALGADGISDALFRHREILVVFLGLALVTYACQHLTRGILSGNGRFGPYGLILAVEGLVRLVPIAVLYAAGIDDLVWYGLAFALPPLVASVVAMRGQHGLLGPGPEAPWSELTANLSWLFGGSVLSQLLSYSPVLGILALADKSQHDLAADFIVGFFLARIPILLFQAVQAALLPKLASLAGAGRHDDFRVGLNKLLAIVLAVGAIGVVGGGTLGPTAGERLFGDKFTLGGGDLALLAGGSGLFILALTLAQALIALERHSRATWSWVAGSVGFWTVTLASDSELLTRVELGFLAGAAAAAGTTAWFLRRRMRDAIPDGSLAHLVEQIEHEPLEI